MRTVVRRRHRTWMVSMSLASLGWGCWWIFAFLTHFAPEYAPSVRVVSWVSCGFAAVGLLAGVWTVRAKLAWLLFTLIPLTANGSLLLMPAVMKTLKVIREGEARGVERGEDVAPVDQNPRQG